MPRFGGSGGRRETPRDDAGATDYGTPARRSNRALRPAILFNHWLHWISSIIVLGIAAYFIHDYNHNTHLIYWLTVAATDALVYIPALVLPLIGSYKGYLAPAAWVFSYLWLTAFIFSAQDYNFNGCARSPSGVNKCHLKRTLEAFAFLAFFTNIIGQILEGWLWGMQPFKKRHNAHADKNIGSTSTSNTTAPMTAMADGAAPVNDRATGAAAV